MSYQVLARKWRPGNFREMVGQEHVLKALINALDHNRLHHAYLFTGTRGVGKTTIARILAKCLNCETGVSSTPCGECGACTEIAEGRFVDLIEVDAASRTRVEDTRELLDNVQYAPTRGRYKIYLIDEVHMLSNHSFNALLKTLEEPPEHVKFLLATTDPQKLPVTILSRCLQFNLKNMSAERIVGHLQQILEKEAVPFEEPALWLLARGADGSMRDALSLTDQSIAYGSGQIVERDVAAMLGTIDHQLIQRLMTGLIDSDGKRLLDAVAAFSEHAPDYNAALADLLTLLHRIAIAQAMPEALDNSFGDRQQILEFAGQMAPENVQLFYQTALLGRRDLHLAPSPRSGFEMTLLRMLAFKPQGVVDVPAERLPASATEAPDRVGGEVKKTRAEAVSQPATAVASAMVKTPDEPPVQEQEKTAPVSQASPLATSNNTQVIENPQNLPQIGTAVRSDAADRASVPVEGGEVLAQKPPENRISDIKQALKAQIKEITGTEGIVARERLSVVVDSAPTTGADSDIRPTQAADAPQGLSVATKIGLEAFVPKSWTNVYRQLNIRGILQSTASNLVLLGRDADQCYFALDESKASLFDSSHCQRLADLLGDYFGQRISVDINIQPLPEGSETPALQAEREKQERYERALLELADDPVVQALEREFDAVLDKASVSFDD